MLSVRHVSHGMTITICSLGIFFLKKKVKKADLFSVGSTNEENENE